MHYKLPMPSELRSRLRDHRLAAGLSVSDLAERIGISRQALTTIEAGRSTPSTAVSLRLGRALGCRVEALFTLVDDTLPSTDLAPGTRVVLGRIAGRWVAHPVDKASTQPADGLVDEHGSVELFDDPAALGDLALIAGCAPVLGALAGRGGARWLQQTSRQALQALADGQTHMAGMHLARHSEPGTHDDLVRQLLPQVAVDIVGLVGWREGLSVAPGNPLGIQGITDLGQEALRVARRQPGAGATSVLVEALGAAGLDATTLKGPQVASHLDAATAVLHGAADAAVVIEPVAEALGLVFLPLSEERFELVVRRDHRDHPGVTRLLDALSEARFSREVRSMGAYDTAITGQYRQLGAA